jgi:hypothetical protein
MSKPIERVEIVTTRYEKTAASFLSALCLAAIADWLRRAEASERR